MSAGRYRRANPRRLTVASVVVTVVDLSIVAWGLLAALDPEVLTAGFETFSGGSWNDFMGREAAAADFVLVAFRLIGALNVAAGLALVAIAVTAFRRGERWAWWTILLVNTLAIGSPILYDRAVGFIGTFEILEYVALAATFAVLAVTAVPARRRGVTLPGDSELPARR